jgi:hypothetical protein
MVVNEFEVQRVLNVLKNRLFYYVVFYVLLNLITAPLLVAFIVYFLKLPEILVLVLAVILTLLYYYFIFVRIYLIAPVLMVEKKVSPWKVLKDAWNKSKGYQEFLLKISLVGVIFYGLSISLPAIINDVFLSTTLIVFFSGVSLPIIKILFVKAGMFVLER